MRLRMLHFNFVSLQLDLSLELLLLLLIDYFFGLLVVGLFIALDESGLIVQFAYLKATDRIAHHRFPHLKGRFEEGQA